MTTRLRKSVCRLETCKSVSQPFSPGDGIVICCPFPHFFCANNYIVVSSDAQRALHTRIRKDMNHVTTLECRAYQGHMLYFTRHTARFKLRRLQKLGIIRSRDLNDNLFDHTNWYCLTSYGSNLMITVETKYSENQIFRFASFRR